MFSLSVNVLKTYQFPFHLAKYYSQSAEIRTSANLAQSRKSLIAYLFLIPRRICYHGRVVHFRYVSFGPISEKKDASRRTRHLEASEIPMITRQVLAPLTRLIFRIVCRVNQ